jgi:hypothetical protein
MDNRTGVGRCASRRSAALRAEPSCTVSGLRPAAAIAGREPSDDELRWARVHIEADRRKPFAFVREVWR